jgi:hypothetical protein
MKLQKLLKENNDFDKQSLIKRLETIVKRWEDAGRKNPVKDNNYEFNLGMSAAYQSCADTLNYIVKELKK